MPKRSTVLRELLRQRHWQTYATFCRQYDEAAQAIDPVLVGRWPSRGQFARWLSGDIKGLPHPDHCRVLEAMFPGLGVQDLFAPSDRSRTTPTDDHELAEPAGDHHASPIPTARQSPDTTDVQLVAPATPSRPTQLSRRAGPVERGVFMSSRSDGFARGGPGEVDHNRLDQLGSDVRKLAVDYLRRPPLTLLRPLSRLRAEVFDLLDRRQRPALLPPLYAVAGRLCALLAHASADLGHGYAAETHSRTAWLCADLADDDSLRAYVRWVQSNVAFWDGNYRQAAQIAQSGQRYATKGSNLLRLASQEARAWAACGEAAEVERALGLTSRTRDRPVVDDQAGVFRFDPGKAAYYASEVRLALGGPVNARLAIQDANEALSLFETAPEAQHSPEFVAAARLDLANAQLALTDLDSAANQLRIVLKLPVESRTEPIVGRVAAADETLHSAMFTRSALALELRDEIALFRAYPARRDLSEALD
jgi:hypothetical protein